MSAHGQKDKKFGDEPENQRRRVQVFISYSHKDSYWKDWLLDTPIATSSIGTVEIWSDDEIRPSDDWYDVIKKAFREAEVALLLVSKNFLASEFIRQEELQEALTERQDGKKKIAWVPIDNVDTESLGLEPIQAAWDPSRPLKKMLGSRNPDLLRVAKDRIWENILYTLDPFGTQVRKAVQSNFELHRELGSGGSRVAFSARDHTMKRWVAVTALKNTEALEEFRKSLLQARIIDGIGGFYAIHGAVLDFNPPYFVTQHIEGETLASRIKRHQALSFSYAFGILLAVGETLAKAHRRYFYHLNVKPTNILLDQDDRPFLSPLSRAPSYFQDCGELWTTWVTNEHWEELQYAIPEFYDRGFPSADLAKSDQYLLGLVAYEMITGSSTRHKSMTELPTSIQDFVPLKPINETKLGKLCPEDLAGIVMRMIDPDPANRFPSISVVVDLIRSLGTVQVLQARDSYYHVTEDSERLARTLDGFYNEFLSEMKSEKAKNDLSALRVKGMGAHQRLIAEAILLLIAHADLEKCSEREPNLLTRVADRHKGMNLVDEDFQLFLDKLVDALVAADDRAASRSERAVLCKAWLATLGPGVNYIRKRSSHRRAAR